MPLVQAIGKGLTVAGTTQTTPAISTTAKNALAFFAVYNAASAGVVTPSDSTGLIWTPVAGSPYSGGATGLRLACWVARNITGNVANTFTFATTGADTPTFFVGEFSGRDLFVPFDISVTASDVSAGSGSHFTGLINATGGDDLLAFNVSSALSQTYTSTGSWAIPPNGVVNANGGYDAFIQYINNANNGANSNTYLVAVADKLDAFIVALKPPALAYGDEFFDWFIEEPELVPMLQSYQQQDLQPQILDVEIEWNNEVDDGEAWTIVEAQSSIVGANNVTSGTAQYYGDTAELLDEVLEQERFAGGYQCNDNFPTPPFTDAWDWSYDDAWAFQTVITTGFMQDSIVDNRALSVDPWDWDEDPDDFFADDFGNDDADPPQNEPWDHFTSDGYEFHVTNAGYFTPNNTGPTPLNIEDGWDAEHFGTEDADVLWTIDDFQNPVNALLNSEDPTLWDEEPDQYDGTTTDLDPVGSNNNPVITIEDAWDHFPTDDDDYVVIDDYALVDVALDAIIIVEDPWDFAPNDGDDETYQLLDTDPVGPTLVIAFAMPPEDPWEHCLTEDDTYVTPDDYPIIDVVVSAQVPVADAWDHFDTDGDDYAIDDGYVAVDNAPITVEDPWDHFTTDPDDELFFSLNTDTVEPLAALNTVGDGWDHFTTDPDDELFFSLNTEPVEPLAALNTQGDTWDYFTDDGYEWTYIASGFRQLDLPVPFSQFTDENFDWWYEYAEDQEQDFGTEPAPLSPNAYAVDPSYEVYMFLRTFTVVWTPDV